MSQLTHLTKATLRPRHVLTHLLEFSLFGGIVAVMAVGIMRLQ